MYHSLFDKKTHQWNIPPAAFESDLEYLRENGYNTVFVSDLAEYVGGGAALPPNPIVLTFDDGYYNNYTQAMPLLEKYDVKIVLSIIGSASDLWTQYPGEKNENGGHLTWPQIAEMAASRRVEFANHTQNLHKTDRGRNGCCRKKSENLTEYEELLSSDVTALQKKLELATGMAPICFTYPFGSMCEESESILKKLGFKATLSCMSGINSIKAGDESCLYHLKRNNRTMENTVKDILESI